MAGDCWNGYSIMTKVIPMMDFRNCFSHELTDNWQTALSAVHIRAASEPLPTGWEFIYAANSISFHRDVMYGMS